MSKDRFVVSELGRLVGASAQEFNRLLAEQGFQEKVPGGYRLTDKGASVAERTLRTSSDLPQARSWDSTTWPSSIVERLDTSREALAKVRTDLTAERVARAAKLRSERADADAEFIASQTKDVVKTVSRSVDVKVVAYGAAGVLAIGAVGLAIAVPVQRARAAKRAAAEAATEAAASQTSPDDVDDR